jgi:hypothetical protein
MNRLLEDRYCIFLLGETSNTAPFYPPKPRVLEVCLGARAAKCYQFAKSLFKQHEPGRPVHVKTPVPISKMMQRINQTVGDRGRAFLVTAPAYVALPQQSVPN